MSDSGLASGDAEHEFEGRVQGGEQPCRHRDRRDQRNHLAVRKQNAYASNNPNTPPDAPMVGAGAAPNIAGTISWVSAAVTERREIAGEHPARADIALDLGAEHPQAEHIEEQMRHVRCRAGTHRSRSARRENMTPRQAAATATTQTTLRTRRANTLQGIDQHVRSDQRFDGSEFHVRTKPWLSAGRRYSSAPCTRYSSTTIPSPTTTWTAELRDVMPELQLRGNGGRQRRRRHPDRGSSC